MCVTLIMHGEKEKKNHPTLIEEIKGKRLFRRHEIWTEGEAYIKLDFCLTVHHQLRKVILMNQLDATKIY